MKLSAFPPKAVESVERCACCASPLESSCGQRPIGRLERNSTGQALGSSTDKSGKTTFSVFYWTALVLYVCLYTGSIW